MSEISSNSKFSLVREIAALLKLGEGGKLDSFFYRLEKKLNREISGHEKNLEVEKFNHEQRVIALEDALEDAEAELKDSYKKIDVRLISNNADQNDFVEIYLENIDDHEEAVEKIKANIAAEKDAYLKTVADIQAQIDSCKKRKTKILAE